MGEQVYQLPAVTTEDNTDLFEVYQQTDNTQRRVTKLSAATKYGWEMEQITTVTSAQLLALFATPQTIIAAPGANLAIIPSLVVIRKVAGVAYAGIAAGEDLVLKYTNAAGAEASQHIETTGFLDSTLETIEAAGGVLASVAPVANAAIVLHLLVAEIITGDSDLEVLVRYKVVPTNFAA